MRRESMKCIGHVGRSDHLESFREICSQVSDLRRCDKSAGQSVELQELAKVLVRALWTDKSAGQRLA